MFSRFSKSISNVVSLILANKLSDFNMAELRRDSIMYESVVFGVDHFLHEGEKAVIYSHMIHLNKKHRSSFTPLDSSLGSFLSQKYKNDFYLIGFLTGEGTRSSYDRVFNPADSSYKEIFHAVNRLYSPPIGSLEKMCMRTQKSIFFSTLLPGDQDGVVLLRRVGRDVRDPQFEYANIPGRMDAYVFIRENTGFQIPPSWK
jgi:erythromycin esterase-like protein